MKYEFNCKECGSVKTIEVPMDQISGLEVICDDCGAKMKRSWKASLIVPEYMRAEETQEMAWVNDRMKNRPSGKRKVYY